MDMILELKIDRHTDECRSKPGTQEEDIPTGAVFIIIIILFIY